jgi:hypothetical protein
MSAQNVVQGAQTTIGQLQMTYRDIDPKFWALAVAWEALRFAWYVLDGDLGTAQEKLARVKAAIDDFERNVRQ